MSLPGKKIQINEVNYHVYDEGDSDQVVILLHGQPDTSGMWEHQATALVGAGFRVIAPDMLGYGETDKPQAAARYTADHILADILALIEHLQLPKMDIVGHDWGAFASWELVLRKPELFRKHVALAVGHPGGIFDDMSMASVKTNWYMFMNGQEHAAELYAQKVVWGDLTDPVLNFQLKEGFSYCGVMEGYIPEDHDSRGNASLIVWLNPEYDPARPTTIPENIVL